MEDLMLWRVLGGVPQAFYIDVGVNDPDIGAVSRAFHERGWRGMHIVPNGTLADTLRRQRRGDRVIQATVASVAGLRRSPSASAPAQGTATDDLLIPAMRLDDVFAQTDGAEVHWMRVDLSVVDATALAGWTESATRPWVVVIAGASTLPAADRAMIDSHLADKGYARIYDDGANQFYLSDQQAALAAKFRLPTNAPDKPQLAEFSPVIAHLRDRFETRVAELAQVRERLDQQVAVLGEERDRALAQGEGRIGALSDLVGHLTEDLRQSAQTHLTDLLTRGASLSVASAKVSQPGRDDVRRLSAASAHMAQDHLRDLVDREQRFTETLATLLREAREAAAADAARHAERAQALEAELAQLRRALTDARQDTAASTQAHLQTLITKEQMHAEKLAEAQREAQDARAAAQTQRLADLQALTERERAFTQDLERTHRQAHDEMRIHMERLVADERDRGEVLSRERELRGRLEAETAELRQQVDAAHRAETALRADLMRERTYSTMVRQEIAQLRAGVSWQAFAPVRTLSRLLRINAPPPTLPQTALPPVAAPIRREIKMTEPTHITQILDLHGVAFINAAYRAILGRPADPSGTANYLHRLATGTAKATVIADLAASVEGKKYGAALPGLVELRAQQRRAQHRIWGRISRGGRIERQVNRLEHGLGDTDDHVLRLEQESRTAFERQEHRLERTENQVTHLSQETRASLERQEHQVAQLEQDARFSLGRLETGISHTETHLAQFEQDARSSLDRLEHGLSHTDTHLAQFEQDVRFSLGRLEHGINHTETHLAQFEQESRASFERLGQDLGRIESRLTQFEQDSRASYERLEALILSTIPAPEAAGADRNTPDGNRAIAVKMTRNPRHFPTQA